MKRVRKMGSIPNQIKHQNPNEDQHQHDDSQGNGIDKWRAKDVHVKIRANI